MPVESGVLRAGGDTGGNCSVQVVPSHVHVSFRYAPVLSWPPKRTTLLAAPSYAISTLWRAEGEPAGDSLDQPPDCHVQVSPKYVPTLPLKTSPPKSTVECVA